MFFACRMLVLSKNNCDKNFDHDAFWNWIRMMSRDNIVIVSEQEAPNDFKCIWSKETKTLLDSNKDKGDNNNVRIEKLFTYICQ